MPTECKIEREHARDNMHMAPITMTIKSIISYINSVQPMPYEELQEQKRSRREREEPRINFKSRNGNRITII